MLQTYYVYKDTEGIWLGSSSRPSVVGVVHTTIDKGPEGLLELYGRVQYTISQGVLYTFHTFSCNVSVLEKGSVGIFVVRIQ